MENIQEGVVLSNEGEFARVNVQAHSSCDSCGACESSKMVILAYNSLQARPGQQVRFVMQDGNMMRIAFILFVLPLLAIFGGAFIGYLVSNHFHFHQTGSMVAGGAVLFALSILNIVLYDRKYKLKPGNFAQIVEIVG
jgi:sigma-E factor negative regulatory protein RseC